ncbi:hypothetical protein S7335_5081 [Synechococcus sp. PCC 7335]|uniref:hypothetical protein n=1 Tax=Synechococcus sp. (strain ATCC 29403 / PCC 7335) TaxID=91464 RepID=UPI00017EB850|nr:hypothetical protein [Synechococcus sp. PCC 7335]EDX87372.1 hypothetical protein S7335_5081 [Synechococcus sp. PCC 7335]
MVQSPPTKKTSAAGFKPIIAGGLIISLFSLLTDFNDIKTLIRSPMDFIPTIGSKSATEKLSTVCTGEVIDSAQLSRQQLAELLTIPERESMQRIHEVVEQPYCQLTPINVRAGVEAKREAYPLAFAPDKALIILYEDGEYAGYDFKL